MLRGLDLFCGAGGASVGYARAGIEMVGVDIRTQRRYPFEFHRADAMEFDLSGYDFIHASPPCQHYSQASSDPVKRDSWPDLVGPIRGKLQASGIPWVIENVRHAPLSGNVVMLCGSMFAMRKDGLYIQRHRYFESPWLPFTLVNACNHSGQAITVLRRGACTSEYRIVQRSGKEVRGQCYLVELNTIAKRLMGIDWMTIEELGESIPPAYTEHIGIMIQAALAGAS